MFKGRCVGIFVIGLLWTKIFREMGFMEVHNDKNFNDNWHNQLGLSTLNIRTYFPLASLDRLSRELFGLAGI